MYKSFFKTGQVVEQAFARLAVARGYQVRAATFQADCNEHWDLEISSRDHVKKIDVKGMKRLERSASLQDKWHWIELHGVRERDPGWLYGGTSDLIAFETQADFVLADRFDLMDLVERLVPTNSPRVGLASNSKYKLYGRDGRHDLLTLIETDRIREIAWQVWNK